jgi:hypothetical protein
MGAALPIPVSEVPSNDHEHDHVRKLLRAFGDGGEGVRAGGGIRGVRPRSSGS